MCKTIAFADVCPRCFNLCTIQHATDQRQVVEIQEYETILCHTARLTKQLCSSTVDLETDGQNQTLATFSKLGQDFCQSCDQERIELSSSTQVPAPSQPSVAISNKPVSVTESETKTSESHEHIKRILRGGVSFPYFGYPVRNRRGRQPNIWVDVLDGNHIMALPRRNGRSTSEKPNAVNKKVHTAKKDKVSKTPKKNVGRNIRMGKKRSARIASGAIGNGEKEATKGSNVEGTSGPQTSNLMA